MRGFTSYEVNQATGEVYVVFDGARNAIWSGTVVPDETTIGEAVAGNPAAGWAMGRSAAGPLKWYWTCRAASDGNPEALVAVGEYAEAGIPPNYKAAAKWYGKASAAGDAHGAVMMDESLDLTEIARAVGGLAVGHSGAEAVDCNPADPPTGDLAGRPRHSGTLPCDIALSVLVSIRNVAFYEASEWKDLPVARIAKTYLDAADGSRVRDCERKVPEAQASLRRILLVNAYKWYQIARLVGRPRPEAKWPEMEHNVRNRLDERERSLAARLAERWVADYDSQYTASLEEIGDF